MNIVKSACFFSGLHQKNSLYSIKFSLAETSNLACLLPLSFFLDRNRKEVNTEEHGSMPLYPSPMFSLHHITEIYLWSNVSIHKKACGTAYVFPLWHFHAYVPAWFATLELNTITKCTLLLPRWNISNSFNFITSQLAKIWSYRLRCGYIRVRSNVETLFQKQFFPEIDPNPLWTSEMSLLSCSIFFFHLLL